MRYRRLGKTDLRVSEVGLGTAQLGGPSILSEKIGKRIGLPKIPKNSAVKILELAFDNGINFFDTADKYGNGRAERLLGEQLANKRNKLIIATKCGITSHGERCFKRRYIKTCLEQSLRNLRTDCIDIFQLTKPDISVIATGEIYQLFDGLKKEGKIRFSGISVGSKEEAMKLIDDNKIDTLQIFYNLLNINANKEFIDKAFSNDIGLIVRSPLSSGMLTGKYSYTTRFNSWHPRSQYLFGETLRSRVDAVDAIKNEYNINKNTELIQFALNYLLSNKKISTIIPGASNVEQLVDIMKLYNIRRLSNKEFNSVEKYISSLEVK